MEWIQYGPTTSRPPPVAVASTVCDEDVDLAHDPGYDSAGQSTLAVWGLGLTQVALPRTGPNDEYLWARCAQAFG
jgi:hypothetical protein